MLPQPRRRWAFFPRSVISDHDNPSAHLYRAMAHVVTSRDDEARFYEERANPWLRSMLLNEGADAFRTFQQRYPHVSYVTYEPRSGHRLAEWLSLALSTVDIVVVDPAAPSTIVQWIGELTRPKLQTFLLDADGQLVARDEVPGFVQLYEALCVPAPEAESLGNLGARHTITYGPEKTEFGTNGSAARHVEQTAEQLVEQLTATFDERVARTAKHDVGEINDPESDQS